jgi:hypothetical protein
MEGAHAAEGQASTSLLVQFSKLNGWRSRNRAGVGASQNHVRSTGYGMAPGRDAPQCVAAGHELLLGK